MDVKPIPAVTSLSKGKLRESDSNLNIIINSLLLHLVGHQSLFLWSDSANHHASVESSSSLGESSLLMSSGESGHTALSLRDLELTWPLMHWAYGGDHLWVLKHTGYSRRSQQVCLLSAEDMKQWLQYTLGSEPDAVRFVRIETVTVNPAADGAMQRCPTPGPQTGLVQTATVEARVWNLWFWGFLLLFFYCFYC